MKEKIKVAICYDFDGTLSPGNMQEYGFMPQFSIMPKQFWRRVVAMAKEHDADSNLCYMKLMLDEARARNISLRREDFQANGENIEFFQGVEDWFDRINAYGRERGVEVSHFLLSSGLKEIAEGMSISDAFTRIYACSFMYDACGVAVWPRQVVNYTTKTQFLYRISKGCLDEQDKSVNDKVRTEEMSVPFRQMLYIGDGMTDVPCMSTMTKFGGHAMAVYQPSKKESCKTARQLLTDERVQCIAPADYREGHRIDQYVKALLDKVIADTEFRNAAH